jgi:DNA polymerase
MSYAAPIIAGQETRGEFDFETASEAGFTWDAAANKWIAPPKRNGLAVVGATAYAQHPTTRVLTLRYRLPLIWWNPRTQTWGTGGVKHHWRPGLPNPQELFDYLAGGGVLEAHNVFFERSIWAFVCESKYGWPSLEPFVYQLRCSMAKARVNSLPGGLGDLSDVLKLPTPKDARGKALLDKFSAPRNPTANDPRRWVEPVWEHPGAPPPPLAGKPTREERTAHRAATKAWEQRLTDHLDTLALDDYCGTDLDAEHGASERMYPMTEAERLFWWVDQEINWRGVGVDRQGIEDCIAVLGQVLERYGQEFTQITGGLEVTQLQALKAWLAARGQHMEKMDQDAVEEALKAKPAPGRAPMAPHVRRALEVRALTGSASVKKLFAMVKRCPADNRLRNLIVHHGARTGRPTGEGPQPLNLPKPGPDLAWCDQPTCHRPFKQDAALCPWCFAKAPGKTWHSEWGERPKPLPDHIGLPADYALEVMRAQDMGLVELFFGNALLTISGCIRGLFVAGPGRELIASDYSAIEAVVTAVLAGEQWRIEAFEAGIDIYVASASKITGKSVEWYEDYRKAQGHKHPDRQKIGKVAELGLGFGGWINAWLAFDDSGTFQEDEIRRLILRWREESPAIVEFWGGQFRGKPWDQDARAELFGVEGHAILALQHPGIAFDYKGMTFQCRDGHLFIRLLSGRELTYRDARLVPSQRKNARPGEMSIIYWTWNSNAKYGPPGWVLMNTFGGRLVENIVQATAHDILRHAILNLRAAGYPTVLHVYDEIVTEVPAGRGSVEEQERIMMDLPAWAAGWPIRAAGGWRGVRYRKA